MKQKTMPCGKHKGVPYTDLPDDYLEWALQQDYWFDWTKTALEQEKFRRSQPQPPPKPPKPKVKVKIEYVYRDALTVPVDIRPIVVELFSAGLRTLAKKYHPDLDPANAKVMQDIVSTKHWLMDVFRLKEK